MVLGAFFSAAFLALMITTASLSLLLVYWTLLLLAFNFVYATAFAAPLRHFPEHLIGSATGLMNFGGQIGRFGCPCRDGRAHRGERGFVSRGVLSVAGVRGHISPRRDDLAASRCSGLRCSTDRHPIATGDHHDRPYGPSVRHHHSRRNGHRRNTPAALRCGRRHPRWLYRRYRRAVRGAGVCHPGGSRKDRRAGLHQYTTPTTTMRCYPTPT